MKRRAVILSMVLSASLVLTGCSWSEIKSKFTGEDSSTTSTASQDDDYVASECVSIPEYKGIEVDCTVSDDEVQSQLDSFVSQNSTEKKIKKGKCKKGDTVNIDYEADKKLDFDYEKIIREVINGALDFEECPYETEVNVVLTTNDEIAMINRDYRDLFKPTDVLSFPMIDYVRPGDFSVLEEGLTEDFFNPESGELILGDIILSVDKIIEQAASYGHSQQRELGFLVAHSMLHLFGYDHMQDEEREVMEEKQRDILNMLNLKR